MARSCWAKTDAKVDSEVAREGGARRRVRVAVTRGSAVVEEGMSRSGVVSIMKEGAMMGGFFALASPCFDCGVVGSFVLVRGGFSGWEFY